MHNTSRGAFPVWRFLLLTARDLRLLFASPLVYVVVIAYLILAGVLGFNALIDAGYLTFKPYFQIAPYLMLIIAVVISSNQLLRRRGSLDIVALLPVSTFEYVGAKFFTGLLTLLIPLILSWSLPVAISLAGWGSPDYGLFLAGTLGLLLLGASFLGIGLAASSFVKSQTVAFLVAILLAFIMWLPNQLVPFFSDSVKELLLNLSFAHHTTWFAQGLITGADLGYFLGITIFSLAVACFGLTSRHYSARIPVAAIVQVVIAFVVALFVALLFMKLPLRADMTRDRLFTLDSATVRYVEKLNEDVKIVFFCDEGIPLRLKPYRGEVLNLLRQYERLSGRIEVTVASPSTDSKAASLAKTYGVGPIEMRRVSATTKNVSRIHFGLAIAKGEKVDIIPEVINAIKNRTLEYELTFRIKRLMEKPRKIYFSSGHNEEVDPLSPPEHQGFGALFSKLTEYSFAFHDLEKGPIPSDAAVFVLAGPKRPLSDTAISHLNSFRLGGGPVLALLDGMKFKWNKFVKGVPMQWVKNEVGLKAWLAELGVEQRHDMVLSLRAPRVPAGGSGRTITYALIPMIPFNRKMDIFPYTLSSFVRTKGKPSGLTFNKVITSDPESWRHENVFEENVNWPRTKLQGPFEVGYFISDGRTKTPSRVALFGDSDLFRDRLMRGATTNAIFARHVFTLLLGDETLKHLRFKGRGIVWLKPGSASGRRRVQVIAVLVPVLLIFSLGLLYNLLRRRRGTKKRPKKKAANKGTEK